MATKIQATWRMFLMRKEFARLFKLWTASAITIQRVFRGMLVRIMWWLSHKAVALLFMAHLGSRVLWLGCVHILAAPQGRKIYRRALYEKLRSDCTTLINSVARMFLATKRVQRRRVAYNDAARVIQRGYVVVRGVGLAPARPWC